MKDFMRDTMDDTLNGVRESANNRMNEAFANRFDEAANICVEIITTKIDELFGQINSGSCYPTGTIHAVKAEGTKI
jgi:hypothetical protein